jgi:hypothetical protein
VLLIINQQIIMEYTGYKDRKGKKIMDGDILKINLGIRMDSREKDSNFMYVKVYFLENTWLVTAFKGWRPSGYSDWTLGGTLNNMANKNVEVFNH